MFAFPAFPKSCYVMIAIGLAISGTRARNAHAEKAGYEFFSTAHGQSMMMKDVSLETLLILAPNAPLFTTPKQPVQAIGRLIDLEVESASDDPADFKCSAIVLDNDENYQRQTWLIWNATASEIQESSKLLGWLPIDIERYTYRDKNDEWVLRYAVIFAECPEKHAYEVLLDATEEEMEAQRRANRRPIEIDSYDYTLWPNEPEKLFQRYNAVFVDNSGDNEVETVYMHATLPQIHLLEDLGYQMIDFEYLTYNQDKLMGDSIYGHVVMVHVDEGGDSGHYTEDDIHHLGWEPNLRLVDLETTEALSSYAVFANQNP